MSVINPLLPKQGTLGQSPTVNLPSVSVPGTTTVPKTGTNETPTIDKIFNFVENLFGAVFPNGLGGSDTNTPAPIYTPAPVAPVAASINPLTIALILAGLYLFRKQ